MSNHTDEKHIFPINIDDCPYCSLVDRITELEAENSLLRQAMLNYANDQHTGMNASDKARQDIGEAIEDVGLKFKPKEWFFQ